MNNLAEDITWKINECKKVWESFEYFLDEYVYIEDKENHCELKLELWPKQREILPAIVNEPLLTILKTQQVGLTWLAACAYPLWQGIRNPLDLTIAISVNEDLSGELLQRVYFILDRLPSWLYPPIKTRSQSVLAFQHPDNLVSTFKSLPTTEMGGQSKTPNRLILDETCKNRLIKEIYNASYPGVKKANGQTILISNSLKSGAGWGFTRDYYTDSMKGKNTAKRIFLGWDADPTRPKDFRERVKMAGMDDNEIKERYPATEVEALEAASGGYFGKTLLRHSLENTLIGWKVTIIKNKFKEYDFEEDQHGIGTLWRVPYNQAPDYDGLPYLRRYAIGSDVSEGLGLSYSVAYVMDRLLDELVFRLRSNRVDAYEWSKLLFNLSNYYDRALLCVERTGAGQTVVKELMKLNAPQYQKLVPGSASDTQVTTEIGWSESQQSKYDMSEDLKNWFAITKGTVYCSYLLDEAATWIKHEGTMRLGPEEGKLGDCVIAAGMTIEASNFLGGKPEKTVAPVTGWLKRVHKEYDRERPRVM